MVCSSPCMCVWRWLTLKQNRNWTQIILWMQLYRVRCLSFWNISCELYTVHFRSLTVKGFRRVFICVCIEDADTVLLLRMLCAFFSFSASSSSFFLCHFPIKICAPGNKCDQVDTLTHCVNCLSSWSLTCFGNLTYFTGGFRSSDISLSGKHMLQQWTIDSSVAARSQYCNVTVNVFAALQVMVCDFLEQKFPHL